MTLSSRTPGKLLPALLASCALTFGCSDDGDGKQPTPSDASVTGVPEGTVRRDGGAVDPSLGTPGADSGLAQTADGSVATNLSDAQIAGAIAAVNRAEIDQGKVAASKASSLPVQEYGKRMVDMHTAAQAEQDMLLQTLGIRAADSAVSAMLAGNAQKTLMQLSQAPAGAAFDYAYIAGQVSQHDLVLKMIDSELLPEADSDAIRAELQKALAMVQDHLDVASAVQAQLSPDSGTL